jgi:hypothetical protein
MSSLETQIMAAAHASARGQAHVAARTVARLVHRCDRTPDGWAALSEVLSRLLVGAVAERWRQGWQPADLVHVVGRQLRAVHRQVCAVAIDVEAESYRSSPAGDPGWLAQVDAVTDRPDDAVDGGGGSTLFESSVDPEARRASRSGRYGRGGRDGRDGRAPLVERVVTLAGGVHDGLGAVIDVLGLFQQLLAQPRLCPPPSEWGSTPRVRGSGRAADPKVAERVRALLAKAESTTFPDEAEAFTAKAQELIARHAIDLALLEGQPVVGDVVGRRILIDDPYGRAKSVLVAVIARANRSSAVFNEGLGLSTVFGTPSDLDAVELLFASLLTQATAAMAAAGRTGGARARGRAFRRSFLLAFAYRIGERLAQATASAVTDARAVHGDGVLPVLASRDAAAEEARDAAFPQLRGQRITTSSPEGWIAGRAAADQARLGPEGQLRAG